MTIITFILLFITGILIYIVYKILAVALRLRKSVHNFRSQFFGTDDPGKSDKTASRREKTKKIARDVGEYIEFEEITVSAKMTDDEGNTVRYTATEQQIEDIEWEDIR